jgi:hypothetical protein
VPVFKDETDAELCSSGTHGTKIGPECNGKARKGKYLDQPYGNTKHVSCYALSYVFAE